jgi:hypothetical protein
MVVEGRTRSRKWTSHLFGSPRGGVIRLKEKALRGSIEEAASPNRISAG